LSRPRLVVVPANAKSVPGQQDDGGGPAGSRARDARLLRRRTVSDLNVKIFNVRSEWSL
jgi:hypothetical protein